MMSITRLCFSMLLFVLLIMLLSFWVIVTKNSKQDTTISLSVGFSPPKTTKAIVYIVDGEQTSIISSSSQHNINQASEPTPFFSQNADTTEDSNDGFTTVTSNDKVTDPSVMTKDTWDKVQLEGIDTLLSGGFSPSNATEAIVYITNEEETSIISTNSQHNINQASEPSLSQDAETTEDSNDGFTTVTSNDKVTDSSVMTKDTWDKVQLENLGDPTATPTPMPTTWSPYVVRTFVVLFLLLMST